MQATADTQDALTPDQTVRKPTPKARQGPPYKVYLITNGRRSYIGYTSDVDRRLRQHNGVIKGGARSTRGHVWSLVCYVDGFDTISQAMSFEWRWKHTKRGLRQRQDFVEHHPHLVLSQATR